MVTPVSNSPTDLFNAALANILRVDPNTVYPPTFTSPTGGSIPNPAYVSQQRALLLLGQLQGGSITLAQALDGLVKEAQASTSVASLSYLFFTGSAPSSAGFDYLLASPTNPNDLNDPYYAQFTAENRYINFSVNLGKLGEGSAKFLADYGSLSLAQALAKAYTAIFGTAPDQAKIDAILGGKVFFGGQEHTRAEYFAAYGLDGPNGQGAKAAMVGWLLAEAEKAGLGPYVAANDAFLKDMADGQASYGTNLLVTYAPNPGNPSGGQGPGTDPGNGNTGGNNNGGSNSGGSNSGPTGPSGSPTAPSAPADSDGAANRVNEGAAAGASTGVRASSSDALGLDITYALASDTSGGGFKVNPTTGVITVADPTKLDYETSGFTKSHFVGVTATNALSLSSTTTFEIAIADVAPAAPADANSNANSVAEGAAAGSGTGLTATSLDPNGPAISYALTNSAGGAFKIDAATGVVTVADASKLDFETSGGSYNVTVQASAGTGSSSQTFAIAVTDVPLPAPADTNAAANTVVEGAAADTTVGITAQANDVNGPATAYSLTNSAGGAFKIDATTGVVSVADASKIDFESSGGGYTITVKADAGAAGSTTKDFTVAVTDVAFPAITDADAATNTVAEGAAANTTVGITARASDVNGPATTYSLTNSAGGAFKIDAATGVVSVADASKLDFETSGGSYTITAKADAGAAGSTTKDFTVAVTNVAPSAAVDSDAGANTIVEGAANGSTVGITAASTDVNGPSVTYSLTGDSSGGGFTINAATGVVTVADSARIDYETSGAGKAYSITVQASDGALSSTQAFSIAVTDVAPSIPVDTNASANAIAEGAANGSAVGITASSTDVNGPAVTYSLVGDTSGGGFTINATTGVVTVADSARIDYESSPGHAYTITAQASDGTLSSSQSFTIGVLDVAPSVPVDNNAAANTIAEGAAAGSTVGVVAASADPNGPPVTYSLIGDTSGGAFTVNASTGVVTVFDPVKLDYETSSGSYTIVVQASDGTLAASQAFVIAVTDVAPSTPVDNDASANTVTEGAANGSTVGVTAAAFDVNGPAVTYSLTGDTSGGGFTINAATGVITVADSTKIDFETSGAGNAYNVTAQASLGGLSSSQVFTIAVTDVAPSTPVDANAATNSVLEGAAAGTLVGITASATDVNGPAVTYGLLISGGGAFKIDSATGVVSVNDPTKLNFESTPNLSIIVQAFDGTLTTAQGFSIAIADVPLSAVTDTNAAANTVVEGAANGTAIGITAFASDPNGPAVTYSLTGESLPGAFKIDPSTGVVTVADATKINYEGSGGFADITVRADAGAAGSTTANFAIGITDAAPSTPVDSNAAANQVSVGAANGSMVGLTASSTDVNGPAVTYSLTGDTSGGGFTINAATGVVSVADNSKVTYNAADPKFTVTAQASDGTLSASQTFDIAVLPNQAPALTAGHTLAYTENQPLQFVDGAITLSDPDGPSIVSGKVQITGNYAAGQDFLAIQANPVGLTSSFDAGSGTLTITPVSGTTTVSQMQTALRSVAYLNTSQNPSGLDRTLTFTVNDSLVDGTATGTIKVTPVNDAPSAVGSSVSGFEDVAYVFKVSDFAFTDAAEGHSLQAIKTSSNPTSGALTNNGVAVNAGDTVSAADIAAGKLQFTGALNASGSPYGAFGFYVQDSGGTANGGVDVSSNAAQMTITLASVNDAPQGTDATLAVVKNTPLTLATANFGFSDPVEGNTLAGVRFTTLPAAGTLKDNGVDVKAGDLIPVADITGSKLSYTPATGFTGPVTLTFQVQDNGGTANGGLDLDQSPNTLTFDVKNINQAPDGTDKTITILEDSGPATALTVADFGLNDPDGNSLLAVKITTLPSAALGVLKNDGSPVTAGSTIQLSDITGGKLIFTPAANANGSASFTFQVQDNGGTANGGVDLDQSPNTLTYAITSVNDAPMAADRSVTGFEDTTLTFTTSNFGFSDPNDSPANALKAIKIFALPIDGVVSLNGSAVGVNDVIQASDIAAGKFTFKGAQDGFGSGPYGALGFKVQDDGDTLNGGVDLSVAPAALSINLTAVNDAPQGTSATLDGVEDIPYILGTSAFGFSDPVEGNAFAGVKITTLPSLGSVKVNGVAVNAGDTVSATDIGNGLLTYTTAANGNGTAYSSFTFQVKDNGGTANGGVEYDATPKTLTFNMAPSNDAPTASNFTFNGANSATANTDLVVNDSADGAPDPAGPQKTISASLLGGAADVDGPGPLVIVAGTIATAQGGSVVMQADGDFIFKPKVGYTGADSFTYQVSDQNAAGLGPTPGLASGTVTLNVIGPKIWYVDAVNGNDTTGDGSSEKPYASLAKLNGTSNNGAATGDPDAAGDTIFLYGGTYTGGITLEANQILISKAYGLTVSDGATGSLTLEAASGSNAKINGTVTLASGNTIRGVDFGTSAAGAYALQDGGSSVGSLTISNSSISNSAGGAMSIAAGGALNVDFAVLTSGAGTYGLNLSGGATGTFQAHGGALSGAGVTMNVSGGSVSTTLEGTLSGPSGRVVQITSMTGGTQTFSGAISGREIFLQNNTGATFNFEGGMTMSAATGTAFQAIGGGTVNVTGLNNTLTATTGMALSIANTTIGANNVTFKSISAGTGSDSSGNAVVLDNTGSSGGLRVTGTGTTAGSGGTIQHKSGADGSTAGGIGIYLNATKDVQLANMQLNDFQNYAIRGLSVDGFSLTGSTISGTNGTSEAVDEGAIAFGTRPASAANGATGTVTITNTTVSGTAIEDAIRFYNNAGTLNLTVNNLKVSGAGNDGLIVESYGTATINADVKNSTFSANKGDHFQAAGGDGGNLNIQLGNNGANTMSGGHPSALGQGVTVGTGNPWTGSGTVVIANNTINDAKDTAINVNVGGSGTFLATVNNNTIGTSGVTNSGTVNNEDAIRIVANGQGAGTIGGTLTAAVTNNTIQQVSGIGIAVIARDGGTNADPIELNITIQGNLLRQPAPGLQAIRVDASATSADVVKVHANIGGAGGLANTIQGDWGAAIPADEIRITNPRSNLNQFILTDLGADTTTTAPVVTYLTNRNNFSGGGSSIVSATIGGGGSYKTGGTAPQPLTAAAGGVESALLDINQPSLTQSLLDSVVAKAIGLWAKAGAAASQIASLLNLSFGVGELSGDFVGSHTSGHITLDADAAGHGWFVDATPDDNAEFAHAAGGTSLLADPSSPAAGKLDLLTAVMHEMGHELGLDDAYGAGASGSLMYGQLMDGERRLPTALDLLPTAAANGQTLVLDVSGLIGVLPVEAMRVREDAGGASASLQFELSTDQGLVWADVLQLNGVHAGDEVAVTAGGSSALMHADWFV